MKIINLIENTKGHEGCAYAHGLSFYVETTKHKLLLDLGSSELSALLLQDYICSFLYHSGVFEDILLRIPFSYIAKRLNPIVLS